MGAKTTGDAHDGLPPELVRQILTRREEHEDGRVIAARVVARHATPGGGAYLVIAALIDVQRRNGQFQRFTRVAFAFTAGPHIRVITIRPQDAPELGRVLIEAAAAADELT